MQNLNKVRLTAFLQSVVFLFISGSVFAQYSDWTSPAKITNGYVDKNPVMGTLRMADSYYNILYEMLVFERHNAPNSRICAMKLYGTGPSDTTVYITPETNTKNINPSVAMTRDYSGSNSCMAVWQKFVNNKWMLYGSVYRNNTNVWSVPFPVDTTADCLNPFIFNNDAANYVLVYSRNNDIIYRVFNITSNTVIVDSNLTSSEPLACGNPAICDMSFSQGDLYLTYERANVSGAKDNSRDIMLKKKYTNNTWSAPVLISNGRSSRNLQYGRSFTVSLFAIYEGYQTNGKRSLYASAISSNLSFTHETVLADSNDNSGYISQLFFVVTDSPDYFGQNIAGCVRKKADSTHVMSAYFGGTPTRRLKYAGDTSKTPVIALGCGIRPAINIYNPKVWMVFNIDSAGYSNLWASWCVFPVNDIKKTVGQIPSAFALHQNYPNPFNPVTRIRYDIPVCHSGVGRNLVKLLVYDVAGREVDMLVNERQTAGSYEAVWDGTRFASGVYFYRLSSGDFIETKKLLLIK
ncbi:MAG: T9SS type A sorting domain-containing protein [Ignavibacteriae bacterium]|nr:T9SS type A sorting domain-containing protein [Ignavibacteriota bacterium]